MIREASLLLIVALTLVSFPLLAADWGSCADALEDVESAADNAADAANEVKTRFEEYEKCRRDPTFYDTAMDRCRGKSVEYESYVRRLASELDSVKRKISYASSACDYQLASGTSTNDPRRGSTSRGTAALDAKNCDFLRSLKGLMSVTEAINSCAASYLEADCRRCLTK